MANTPDPSIIPVPTMTPAPTTEMPAPTTEAPTFAPVTTMPVFTTQPPFTTEPALSFDDRAVTVGEMRQMFNHFARSLLEGFEGGKHLSSDFHIHLRKHFENVGIIEPSRFDFGGE